MYRARESEPGKLLVDSLIESVWESDGELGNGGTLGARFVDEALA